MKKRYTEEQIIKFLKEIEARVKVKGDVRPQRFQKSTY